MTGSCTVEGFLNMIVTCLIAEKGKIGQKHYVHTFGCYTCL